MFLGILIALAAILIASLLPIRFAFFALGVLLPIDVVSGVAPFTLDIARYGAALILILRTAKISTNRTNTLQRLLFLLVFSFSALLLLKGILFDDLSTIQKAFIGGLSSSVAFLLSSRHHAHKFILFGFIFGAFLNAATILWAVFIPTSATGTSIRYAGLSFSSTHIAPFIAVAIVFTAMPWLWENRKHRLLRFITFAVLLLGLAYSGGRGGFAGLILAFVLSLIVKFKRAPFSAIVVSGLALFLVFRVQTVIDWISVNILREGTQAGFTSRRGEFNDASWDAFWEGGLLGTPIGERNLFQPHMAPLTFALDVGPFGLVAGGVLCLVVIAAIIRFTPGIPVEFRMVATIALVTALLEPNGFFVGLSKILIIMLCVGTPSTSAAQTSRHEQPDPPNTSVSSETTQTQQSLYPTTSIDSARPVAKRSNQRRPIL